MKRMIGIVLFVLASMVVWIPTDGQALELNLFILQARADLELLANDFLGEGERPETWTFNTDLESETVIVDLWFDNEQLADTIYGNGQRPEGWFGATSRDPVLIARNTRHDLELAADTIFGEGERPAVWNGAPAIFRCDRTTQNLARLLNSFYNVQPTTAQSVLDYCAAVKSEIESELVISVYEAQAPGAQVAELSLALRGDLERLANELLGVNERPPAWIGNVTADSPTLVPDTAADLERLADIALGSGERPPEWEIFIASSQAVSYRNLRFNLEQLADATQGVNNRPSGWQGVNAVERCDVSQQTLVFILQINYDFVVDQTLTASDNFCDVLAFSANNFAENPPEEVFTEEDRIDLRFRAEANFAFSYLDVAALQYMGIMPAGTEFRAWYRNYSESNMMFVSGQDFALYIDRRFTTMEEEVFRTLPNLDGVIPLTFCDANWCNGPSPTPTPTGVGPLLAILGEATQPAPVDAGSAAGQGQEIVAWDSIRATYLADDTEAGTARVALEICATPQQINCEPVIRVFDNSLGINKPVLGQFNGLNIYEFRYGFSDSVVIEGSTRTSFSIWISDPTIR